MCNIFGVTAAHINPIKSCKHHTVIQIIRATKKIFKPLLCNKVCYTNESPMRFEVVPAKL